MLSVVCAPRGKLFRYALASSTDNAKRVSYLCPPPTAEDASCLFGEQQTRSKGGCSTVALKRINMTYLLSCSALRCYFSCVQVLNELPDIIVIDGFFELRGAELDAELGSQWLSTMAAAADAAAYLKQRCVDNPVCFALQRCPRLHPYGTLHALSQLTHSFPHATCHLLPFLSQDRLGFAL